MIGLSGQWRAHVTIAGVVFAIFAAANRAGAVAVSQVDAFSTTLQFWQQGQVNTVTAGVFRETTGGPAGAGDGFMRIRADGNDSHGSLVAFNRDRQWSGNYTTAGVQAISMSLKNFSSTTLQMRIAISNTGTSSGRWWASTAAISLPGNSDWTTVTFPLGAGDLTMIRGGGTYATLMVGVGTLRLLHAPGPPDYQGVTINATLGVDNITSLGAASLPGDFNGDLSINGADLALWKGDFGVDAGCDGDGDGDTDGADLLIWQRNVGRAAEASALSTVPEPSATILLIACGSVLRSRVRW